MHCGQVESAGEESASCERLFPLRERDIFLFGTAIFFILHKFTIQKQSMTAALQIFFYKNTLYLFSISIMVVSSSATPMEKA